MLPIGTKVFHNGHGVGEVIAHNTRPRNSYLEAKPLEAIKLATQPELLEVFDESQIISALAASFYNGDRYPNRIKFVSGYEDVYADTEISVIN